jgi:hypothetical protein
MGSGSWELPITKEPKTALDQEGTKIILNRLKRKISLSETEKYLRQSVPLRAKKFSVYLNNKRITAKTIAGKIFPIKANTIYGLIEGEIIVALSASDVDEPGIECRVKQVFIRRSFFGVDKKHAQGQNRIAGFVNADFLPLISSRSDFIVDSPEYVFFRQFMAAQLDKVLKDLKQQGETKNLQKVTKDLEGIMKQLREALILNPEFIPQGRAVSRLKKEGKQKIAAASTDFSIVRDQDKKPDREADDKKIKESGGLDRKETEDGKKKKDPEEKIDVKPIALKRIKLNKLGISCGIVSLGEKGPEALSQGNAVYINQDHPLYKKLYAKKDQFFFHLLRLVTQEVVLMKKMRITAREAFDWQSKLLKGAICGGNEKDPE